MSSFLLLPPDLSLLMGQFTTEEIEQIVPDEHEIITLPFRHLTKQMADNALTYATDHQLSPAAGRMLRYWLYICDDERLVNLATGTGNIWDNMWQMIALGTKFNDFMKVKGRVKLMPARDDDHPYFKKLEILFGKLARIEGDVNAFYELLQTMLNDPLFFYEHLIEMLVYTFYMSGPLITIPEKVLPLFTMTTKFARNYNLEYVATRLTLSTANIMMYTSRMEQAIPLFEQCETYAEKHGFDFGRNATNNKGIVYFMSGQWDEAIDIYEGLLEKYPDMLLAVNNIADAYSRKGEMEKAWSYAKRYLKEANTFIVMNYEFIQSIIYALGLDEEAEKLMTKVRKIREENDIQINHAGILLMEARHARYRMNMGMAQDKIDEALELSMEWKNIQLMFMLLIERIKIFIDLSEMKPTPNNRQRLFNAVNDLIQLSDEQQVAIGSINGLAMRADIYLSYGEEKKARNDLYTAAKIAKEFEYTSLYIKLEKDLAKITLDTVEESSRFSRLKTRLREIVGLSSTRDYEEKGTTTHGTIVMSQFGLPVFTDYITDKVKSDSSLISGLISAVSSMLNEATQTQGFLKTIQRDDFSLLFEPVMNYMVVSVVSEDSFEARQHLKNFTRRTRELLEKYNLEEEAHEIPPSFENEMHQAVKMTLI